MLVLQVTHKADDIGMLGVNTVNHPLQQRATGACQRAHMGVAEEGYAVAVERSGQVTACILHPHHFQL